MFTILRFKKTCLRNKKEKYYETINRQAEECVEAHR